VRWALFLPPRVRWALFLPASIFLGFLRSEATRLLLKLRAGLFEAAGYCIYAVPQIRYLHGHARGSQKPAAKHTEIGHRPWADALGGTPKTKNGQEGWG
jgi:hypothetical protein